MARVGLADITFQRIVEKYGDRVDPSKLPIPQQTVMLVYHSYGILGNGCFEYLFAHDVVGDPGFELTRKAYKTIGATEATKAFDKAFAVFPKSKPPGDRGRRLEIWRSRYKLTDSVLDPSSPDRLYLDAMPQIMEELESYIKAEESAFPKASWTEGWPWLRTLISRK